MSGDTRLEVGQVWHHHTVAGDYTVTNLRRDGRVTIGLAGEHRHCDRHVWPDYLRRNFTLYPGVAASPETDT